MNKIVIDIWSDIACPYCYIGKRKLEQALGQIPEIEPEINWHSYELNPALPSTPLTDSWVEYMQKEHNMTPAQAQKKGDSITRIAKEVGLDFHLDKVVVANTSYALRLAKLASQYGKATEAEEILFHAYFVDGRDVSHRAFLVSVAEQLHLPVAEVEAMLDGDIYKQEIVDDIAYSENKLSLEYIPFYRINNSVTIQGSLSVEQYVNALKVAVRGNKDSFQGDSCSIDGVCS